MVSSYNDPVKQLAREKLRDFIKKNLLSIKKPKDVKVVCFPGAEVAGEEALEVKEVYDPLGIPRQNIVGLEYDVEKAERLQKTNLGIQVFTGSDFNFFKQTKDRYDIISLDYTGQQTKSVIDSLMQISGRTLLNRISILTTNFAAQRESKDLQKVYLHRSLKHLNRGHDLDPRELIEKLENIDSLDLNEVRKGVTGEVLTIMADGTVSVTLPRVLTAHPYVDYLERELDKGRVKFFSEEADTISNLLNSGIMRGGSIKTIEELKNAFADPHDLGKNNWMTNQKIFLSHYIQEKYDLTKFLADGIVDAMVVKEARGYQSRAIERYRYTSNKKTDMMMDVHLLKRTELPHVDDLAIISADGLIYINPLRLSPDDFRKKYVVSLRETYDDMQARPLIPDQLYLGSSYKRPQTINKKNALDLFATGCSPKEIHEAYPGTKVHKLAAWKAHMTMGTYQK